MTSVGVDWSYQQGTPAEREMAMITIDWFEADKIDGKGGAPASRTYEHPANVIGKVMSLAGNPLIISVQIKGDIQGQSDLRVDQGWNRDERGQWVKEYDHY